MPNELEYFADFSNLNRLLSERVEYSESRTYAIKRFYKLELPSNYNEGDEEGISKLKEAFRLPLLKSKVHFSTLDFYSMIGKSTKLEDLCSRVLLERFFKKCLELFKKAPIADEMLFKGLFNDLSMFYHFKANFRKKEIDREEHRKDFLEASQGVLDFFEERFDEARKFILRKMAPAIFERELSLSSLGIDDLMKLEDKFHKLLQALHDRCQIKLKACPLVQSVNDGPKVCSLCERVDAMEFLGEFFRYSRCIKSILIPRYLLFAMIAYKAFKVHLLPFCELANDVLNRAMMHNLFAEEVEIIFREGVHKHSIKEVLKDVCETMICKQFTSFFVQEKTFRARGWQGDYDFRIDFGNFYYYYENDPTERRPSYPDDFHYWCNGECHHIGDLDLGGRALSSIIMFAIISNGVLKNYIDIH